MLKRAVLLLIGLASMAGFLATLDLNWAAIFRGDINAGTEELRRLAESQGAMKGLMMTAMIAFLPSVMVPISLILLAAAMVLPWPLAIASIMVGTAVNTAISFTVGRIWGTKAIEFMGLERFRLLQLLKDGVAEHGFKMALFARCLPVPFALPAIAAAVVGLRFWQMMAGTAIMMLPWSVIYVFFTEALRRGDARYLGPAVALFAIVSLAAWWVRRSRAGEAGLPKGLLAPQSPPMGPEITLYTLPGHEACEDARIELWNLRERLRFEVREVDISQDPGLLARHHDMAPVVYLGERKLFSFQVDENALENYLKASRD